MRKVSLLFLFIHSSFESKIKLQIFFFENYVTRFCHRSLFVYLFMNFIYKVNNLYTHTILNKIGLNFTKSEQR